MSSAAGVKLTDRAEVERTLGLGIHSKQWRRLAVRCVLLGALGIPLLLAVRAMVVQRRALPRQRFETATIVRGDLRATVTATGTLHAVGTVEVGSEVSGRVLRVLVDYNEHATKGELLAEIDPVQLLAEVTQAVAQVAAASAGVAQANATLVESEQAVRRAEAQAQEALVATKDLEAARATYARARANVVSAKASAALAEAALKSANWKLGKTKIVSPIDGIVLTRSVEPGQTVQAAFTTPVLFKLASDLSHLELHVQVDEADLGRVHEGLDAEFRVDAYPEKAFASRVQRLHNDSTTSNNVVTYEAVLSVDNIERLLRPGMTATATIVSESRTNVLLVPNAALRFAPPAPDKGGGPLPPPPSGHTMQVVAPDGGASKRHVFLLRDGVPIAVFLRTDATDGKNTEVLTGELNPGTQVLTDVLEEMP